MFEEEHQRFNDLILSTKLESLSDFDYFQNGNSRIGVFHIHGFATKSPPLVSLLYLHNTTWLQK